MLFLGTEHRRGVTPVCAQILKILPETMVVYMRKYEKKF